MIGQFVAWHLGALHPVEKGLTFGLAFGPFLILFAVILIRRRQDQAAERSNAAFSGAEATPDPSETPSSTP